MHKPKIVRKGLLFIGIMTVLIFLEGCAHRYYFEPSINDQTGRLYIPEEIPIRPGMIIKPEFNIVKEVALVNTQKDADPYFIGKYTHAWTANLKAWTDTAIGVLKTELKRNDVTITMEAQKMLMLSVNHVELFWELRTVGCTLELEVVTRDGYVAAYTATCESTDVHDSSNGAVTRAVAKMFEDDKIRAYLKGPDRILDTDCDGVFDDKDECPDTPRGVAVDEKGCPLDADDDGVPDYLDECPNTPKGVEVDEKGCPLDTDGDGVPDYLDECPNTPKGAIVDERGCWVIDGAFFDFDKYIVKPQYFAVLDHVVEIMEANPDLKIEIQGHCDNRGTMEYNQILSENRSKAAMSYFVRKGIPVNRFVIKGFSFTKPRATNETDEGRALNRRVELMSIPE